jgi:hypothetical protein
MLSGATAVAADVLLRSGQICWISGKCWTERHMIFFRIRWHEGSRLTTSHNHALQILCKPTAQEHHSPATQVPDVYIQLPATVHVALIVPVLPAEQALLVLQLLPRVVELQAVAHAPATKDAPPVVGTEPGSSAPLQVPAACGVQVWPRVTKFTAHAYDLWGKHGHPAL